MPVSSGHEKKFIFFASVLLLFPHADHGYGLPFVALGSSSFLDGGPLRQIPGWYFQFFNQVYTTHRFLNDEGEPLGGVPSPRYTGWLTAYQLIYLSKKDFLGLGNLGFDIALPVAFYSRVQPNQLGIKSSGSGFGDLLVGVFAQGLPIFRGDKPLYVQRLEFSISIPSGKNQLPRFTINPGNGVFFMNPYWAATLYLDRFSASWEIHYLWVAYNHRINLKAGDAIYGNYALAYQMTEHLFLGINGYFLQQIKDNKLNNIIIPDSRERVFATGFGGLYTFKRRFAEVLLVNFYWEMAVKNRPQGFRFLLRYLRHF